MDQITQARCSHIVHTLIALFSHPYPKHHTSPMIYEMTSSGEKKKLFTWSTFDLICSISDERSRFNNNKSPYIKIRV
jgi:hypothetical protein